MHPWSHSKKTTPKSRKLPGCLIATLIALALILLNLLLFGYFLFRSQPPLDDTIFLSPDAIAFFRFQLTSMDSKAGQELLDNILNQSVNLEGNQRIDPKDVPKTLKTILHTQHFLYLYKEPTGQDSFLIILDIKRFSWMISSLIDQYTGESGSDHGIRVKAIPSPPGIRASCFFLIHQGLFLATSSQAILLANSESRLHRGLNLLLSDQSPPALEDSIRGILPTSDQRDLFSGFILWEKDTADKIGLGLETINPEWGEKWDLVKPSLRETRPRSVVIRCRPLSGGELEARLVIHAQNPKEAKQLASLVGRVFRTQGKQPHTAVQQEKVLLIIAIPDIAALFK